ncbi:MAG TPA: ATP-dependent helicase [Verrucomicrobiae bacterium]|nr:ATP-dependent helicase [Verrucomicrobiae bacterium]
MENIDWKPEGVTLEPAAFTAVKSQRNALVIAGPGAGKTELLAQRACFLLQTGSCPPPYRILAISFKREAAENLKARVILRCGRELASRFDSMTYDAFAKDLLDRFRLSLPQEYCPTTDYDILTGADASENSFRDAFMGLSTDQCSLSNSDRQSITGTALVRQGILGYHLPCESWPRDLNFIAGESMWRALIGLRPSRLTFPMIGRLSEFILRSNSSILTALRGTYKYVFLDEFQDTTTTQFALTEAAFLGSPSILTAVGDTKQKIMGWAGALPGIFQKFEKAFGAKVMELTQNHRSRSKLVAVQSVFAKELDPDSVSVTASRPNDISGECRVLEFADATREAKYLAAVVENAIAHEGVPPEEICILCRARPDSFAQALNESLKGKGIKVRVDVNRREIVSEPVSALLLDIISLLVSDSEPEAWDRVTTLMSEVSGDGGSHEDIVAMRKLLVFLAEQRGLLPQGNIAKTEIGAALNGYLKFIGRDEFAVLHPQYAQDDYLETVVESLAELIVTELPDNGWNGVVNAVRGEGAVSIMTMHKSKGLEFHTVIFLGLEDSAIWNYQKNVDEETCGLFVALSRAKERCIFTYCRSRPGRYGTPAPQTRLTIKRVYELFKEARVDVERIDS